MALDGAKKLLNDTKTQKIIMDDALHVCASLPSDLQKGCSDLVTTYEPVITDYIVSANSAAICMLIGACVSPATKSAIAPSATNPSERPRVGLMQSPESRFFARLRKTILASSQAKTSSISSSSASSTSSTASTDYCDQCKMVVLEAHSLITNPTVQSSILNYTKQVCDLAGPNVAPTCDQVAELYVPVFFDLLEKAFNSPDEICAMIGLCKPKVKSHPSIGAIATERKRQRSQ